MPSFSDSNLLNVSILEVNIVPNEATKNGDVYSSANINFIAKLKTDDLKDIIEFGDFIKNNFKHNLT